MRRLKSRRLRNSPIAISVLISRTRIQLQMGSIGYVRLQNKWAATPHPNKTRSDVTA